jgi:hypothetical protein
MNCDPDIRRDLFANIVLSGGTSVSVFAHVHVNIYECIWHKTLYVKACMTDKDDTFTYMQIRNSHVCVILMLYVQVALHAGFIMMMMMQSWHLCVLMYNLNYMLVSWWSHCIIMKQACNSHNHIIIVFACSFPCSRIHKHTCTKHTCRCPHVDLQGIHIRTHLFRCSRHKCMYVYILHYTSFWTNMHHSRTYSDAQWPARAFRNGDWNFGSTSHTGIVLMCLFACTPLYLCTRTQICIHILWISRAPSRLLAYVSVYIYTCV